MSNFLHKLFNPHCPHCMEEAREQREALRLAKLEEKEDIRTSSECLSCDTLKMQLALANEEKTALLARLLEKPSEPVHSGPAAITRPKLATTFAMRRQILEEEDRKRASLIRNAPKPDASLDESNDALEREILSVESETKEAQ